MRSHDLIGIKFNLVELQRFVEDFLKGGKISLLAKNLRTQVCTVQRVIKPSPLRRLLVI